MDSKTHFKKKAVILARVSTKRQEEEGLSLQDIQLPQLREYAKKNDFEVVKEYVFSESADAKIRKKFNEMVQFVKKNDDVEAIIGFRVDRITRNFRDAVAMDDLRTEYKKELHFVYDRLVIDSKTVGTKITDWDTKVYLAKQFLNRLKEDAVNTWNSKISRGEWSGQAPYGYENIDKANENGKWIKPKPFEAGIVKLMFELYSTGAYSYQLLRDKLKADYKEDFPKSKIEHILKNPFYYGEMKVKEKLYPHKYKTIIDKETFDKVQEIKSSYGKKEPHKFKGLPYPYKGLMRCAICGCAITAEHRVKKQKNGNVHEYTYYHCTFSKGRHEYRNIEEEEITNAIIGILKKLKIPEVDYKKMQKSLLEAHEAEIEFSDSQRKEYQQKTEENRTMLRNAYKDKLKGSITQDLYDELEEEFNQTITFYENKLAELSKAEKEYYITCSFLLAIAKHAWKLFEGSNPQEKREIVKFLFSNLSINEKNVEYELRSPFSAIFNASKCSKWLPE